MVAGLQPLRPQKIRYLVGAWRQRGKRQPGLAVAAGIDDPERRTIPALRIAGQFGIEPVQRPVERSYVGPAKPGDGLVVVRSVFQKKRARFLKGRHVKIPGLTGSPPSS